MDWPPGGRYPTPSECSPVVVQGRPSGQEWEAAQAGQVVVHAASKWQPLTAEWQHGCTLDGAVRCRCHAW